MTPAAYAYWQLTGKFLQPRSHRNHLALERKFEKFRAAAFVGVKASADPSAVRQTPDRLKASHQPPLDLPNDDREALRVFFENERHPAPERILALKHASGLTWSQFKLASLA